jgi:flagellar biosynthesis protein FlhG
MLKMCDEIPGIRELIDEAIDQRHERSPSTPAELIKKIVSIDAITGAAIQRRIDRFDPHLILNQVRNESDIEIGNSIKSVCRKYFGINIHYTGFLEYEHSVWQAVRRKKVLSLDAPGSPLVSHFQNIVKKLSADEAAREMRA